MSYEELQAAAAVIGQRSGHPSHQVAVVLGSGLGAYAATLPGAVQVPYADIPGFPVPRRLGSRILRWVEHEVDAYLLGLPPATDRIEREALRV